jgi:hypothetical protein
LILPVFCIRRVYSGSIFFSLVLILRIPAYLGIKGDHFFSDENFFGTRFTYNWGTTICITHPILRKIECNKFVCNEFVLVLVPIDLIQFVFSNCIRSVCTKLIQICYIHIRYIQFCLKIGHVIQIVVHQFVHKMTDKKIHKSEKNWSPLILRYTGIRRISTKEKKSILLKPHVAEIR